MFNVMLHKLKNKYIIGTHVMFYEIDMVGEYIKSCRRALEDVENKENVKFHFCLNMSTYFEKYDTPDRKGIIMNQWNGMVSDLNAEVDIYHDDENPYTMANYRRELNFMGINYDYTIWGESDSLMPKEMFSSIETISNYATAQNIHRHIITFAIRKMWDDSWKVLEHNKFTDAPFYEMADTKALTEQSSIRYTMSQKEMELINAEVDEYDIRLISYPKFDGSGLVISRDLLMSGANLAPAVYMNGDDTSFMQSCLLHMGEQYRQFVVKNILKVHNRNHPKKRRYVAGEDDKKESHFKRQTNWYKKFNDMSKGNLDKLYKNQSKFFNYEDFKKGREDD
jgi:hypothetical protein